MWYVWTVVFVEIMRFEKKAILFLHAYTVCSKRGIHKGVLTCLNPLNLPVTRHDRSLNKFTIVLKRTVHQKHYYEPTEKGF